MPPRPERQPASGPSEDAAPRKPRVVEASVEHLVVPSDAELVARILEGDRWAEEALYRRHAACLGNLAARLLRDRDAALDVVQDTFVEAFEGLERLRDPARVGGWLRQIAVHQVHRRLRRQKLGAGWASCRGTRTWRSRRAAGR